RRGGAGVSGRPAVLALADGTVFHGEAFGASAEAIGELVFNTSMTGYQEILTDPSYEGQLVAMTYPEIGNVGVNREDVESRKPWVRGFIVREYREAPSSWRAEQPLGDYLAQHGIPGIQCIDTRALVRHPRDARARRTRSRRQRHLRRPVHVDRGPVEARARLHERGRRREGARQAAARRDRLR